MPAVQPVVNLIRHTPEPEDTVATAARLCYAGDTAALFTQQDDPAALLRRLHQMGHLSPFEHAAFTFYIEGVSRALTHQLVRHRLASYSQRSQRYVAHDRFDYVVPPQLTGKMVHTPQGPVDAVTYFAQTMEIIAERYAALNDALGRTGESSNEDARYVLPNACETKIVVTMNARSLLHFFQERLCMRAQWEIRRLAELMLQRVRAVAPALFVAAGPKCVHLGHCPEGKLSCGQFAEVRQRYGSG